mmetsp:Transcript_142051/g.247485  ORF Transcript_142051/g.247485 Transcript_142051/m.247485 type:complete len:652 (+) Transcript_142051:59-2014(+)
MPERQMKGSMSFSFWRETYYANPRGGAGYNQDFPESMRESIVAFDTNGHVKTVEVDLDDEDTTIEVELDECYGPKILPAKPGGEINYVATWPSMTATERNVCLHMVAKRNYKVQGGHLQTVKRYDDMKIVFAETSEATQDEAGKKFPDVPAEIEHSWLSTRSSFGTLTGLARVEDLNSGARAVTKKPKERDPSDRPYDIIIYGATGFTGCLMAEHLDALLSKARGSSTTWAIAGRSENKLRTMANKCKTTPGVIRAATDEEVMTMVSQGKVVISAAGPHFQVGEPVIKACMEKLTHYIDVSGETFWIKEIINKYHALARAKNIAIVHGAGQVAAADEIICYLLAQHLGPLSRFREYAFQYGAQTGGSFNTQIMAMTLSPEISEAANDPFCLGGKRKRDVSEDDGDCTEAVADTLYPSLFHLNSYGGVTGSRFIRRSCELFEERPGVKGPAYGESLVVTIRDLAVNQKGAAATLAQGAKPTDENDAQLLANAMTDQVNQGIMPPPGEGPPPELRSHMYSDFYGVAESETGRWAHVHYTGPEAYEVTAMAAVVGGLVLVEELVQKGTGFAPVKEGGVLTPAFAFHGSSWISRLQASAFANGRGRKMKFEVKDGKPSEEDLKSAITEKSKKAMTAEGLKAEGTIKAFTLPALLA